MAGAKRSKERTARLGEVALRVRADAQAQGATDRLVDEQRKMVADFCRLLLLPPSPARSKDESPPAQGPALDALPPRLQQTLTALLDGDSEKQVARRLNLSQHTVHVYVKSLYRRFNVTSRGELLARWVRRDPNGRDRTTKALPEHLRPANRDGN